MKRIEWYKLWPDVIHCDPKDVDITFLHLNPWLDMFVLDNSTSIDDTIFSGIFAYHLGYLVK